MTAYAAAVLLAGCAGLLLTGPRLCFGRRLAPAWISGLRGVRRAGREEAALREALADLLPALAAELSGGAGPRDALAAAAGGLPSFEPVVAVARSPSGDVLGPLRAVGSRPGGEAATDLAVAWEVTERTGSALADAVGRLAAAHRARESVRREIAAQLAGPRATARLLAGLPAVGLAMGAAFGAQPWRFLIGVPAGRACLAVGACLLVVGLRWTAAIARRAASSLP